MGPHTGVVEAVGLRVTKIRKFSGELRIVPNGELGAFGLHTAGWARLVVEVSVDYEEDVGRALRVLGEVGTGPGRRPSGDASSSRPRRRASCVSPRPRRSCGSMPGWSPARSSRSSSRRGAA